MKIPLVDLKANYLSIKEEIDAAIKNVVDSCSFIGGKYLEEFEENFAKKVGAKYCIGCSSGTSALQIAMKAHGCTCDFVVPTNTFIATAEGGEALGASIEFCDVEENGLIDIDHLVDILGFNGIECAIPVHLYGNVVDVDLIKSKLNKVMPHQADDLIIIEDAAQAHFAKYKDGSYVGSKNTTCFSFFPGKCIGGFGDSGCLTTNDKEIYEYAKAYRDHGRRSKYESSFIGTNLRMDALQAAILNVKLNHILDWNEKRRQCAKKYNELLSGIEQIKLPEYNENSVYHLYVIRELQGRRNELKKFLETNEMSVGIHYPVPLHRQEAFSWANDEYNLPMAEKLSGEILSLPIYPELTTEQIEFVCSKIKEFYK
jgi:dTDP-4-amino-4,6-dideoxygalactose transaminase